MLQFLPFRRPTFSKFRCPRLAYSAELRELAPEPRTFTPATRPSHLSSLRSPGLAAGQSASQTRPTVRSGDLHFHTRALRARSRAPQFHARAPRARSGAQQFYARARSGAPHFSPCRGTTIPKFRLSNNNNVPFLYSAYHIQMASLCARGISTPPPSPRDRSIMEALCASRFFFFSFFFFFFWGGGLFACHFPPLPLDTRFGPLLASHF